LRGDADAAAGASRERIGQLEAEVAGVEELRSENERLASDVEDGSAATGETVEALERQVVLVGELEGQIEQLRGDADAAAGASRERIGQLEAEVAGVEELRSENERLVADAGAAPSDDMVEALEGQIEQLRGDADAAASASRERIQQLEIELSRSERIAQPGQDLYQDDAVVPDDAEVSVPHSEPIDAPEPTAAAEEFADSAEGTSLRDRIGTAEGSGSAPAEDSMLAIRAEAMRALEEARELKDGPRADVAADPTPSEPVSPELTSAAPILDYSPSIPAPARTTDEVDEKEDEEEEEEMVQSRYSRNSAKLPRLGIEPGAASSTIAELRKQMTADG
jgi:hypothetical protein